MKRRVVSWQIEKLHKERTRISFPEYQREKSLWSHQKKSLLIDSILQDIDIPKLYFNRSEKGDYEVVDGQQRLWAIWEYLDDEYGYPPDGTSKARKFSQLSAATKDSIKNYYLQITIFEDAKEDYLRKLFVRLQLGLLVNTGERLNAATGAMKDLVFGKLAAHTFIKKLGIPVRRFAKQTLCAQICINSFRRAKLKTFERTRWEDLRDFFQEYERPQAKDLEFFRKRVGIINTVLDQLWKCFGDRTKELRNRSYILSVYLFFEELIEKDGLSREDQKVFLNLVFRLWKRLREEARAGIDRKNRDLYSFQTLLSSAPGEKYQIERRHQKLVENYDHFKKTGKIKGD